MQRFRVWAPRARDVKVEVRGRRIELAAEPQGWFAADMEDVRPGDDYGYSLDGGPVRPDPRSAWQPAGVHGRSRLVDHAAFPWTDAGWQSAPLDDAVLYELHVGTFTPAGTFEAVIGQLPHLIDLGVSAIELMPVAEFPGRRGWGYDGVALFAPHHAYGGPEGLKRLVDACHAHGLGVILDVVYNHLGPDGNYLQEFGPYFTDRYTTPWGAAINLDGPDSDAVRSFVVDNAVMWLRDYHCDGLRLDAVHAIFDASALHILEELAVHVDALAGQIGRRLHLIAESDLNDPRTVRPIEHGGHGVDAQWSDDFHHALHAVLTGERTGYYADFGSLADLAAALTRVFVYDGRYSAHRRRRHGRPATGLPGSRFLGYLQNHDQVGNRAAGERATALMREGRLRIGAALVICAPFIPLLFQGEEWGASTPFLYFTDHQDPELARAVRQGRQREFGSFGGWSTVVPDPQAEATFWRSQLDWRELARPPHAGLLGWYRDLVALRRRTPALRDSRVEAVRVEYDEAARWLVMERGPVTIACNVADRPVSLPLGVGRGTTILLASGDVSLRGADLALGAESVAIVG
jgi:maltooligosyltrehalose trehalohydrolase